MVDEGVEYALELSPCGAQGASRGDVLGERCVHDRQAWGEDAPVGFREQHGDPLARRGQVVAVGVRPACDQCLAFEASQVIGGLFAGVGGIQQRCDALGELAIVEPRDGMAEAGQCG